MKAQREELLRATEALLAALAGGEAEALDAALAERERAFAALRAAAGTGVDPLGDDAMGERLRALERELREAATRAFDAVSSELREVQELRRVTRRLRGATAARFLDTRV